MDRLIIAALGISLAGMLLLFLVPLPAEPLLRLPEQSVRFTATATGVVHRGSAVIVYAEKCEPARFVYFPWKNETLAVGEHIEVIARSSTYQGREEWIAEEIRHAP